MKKAVAASVVILVVTIALFAQSRLRINTPMLDAVKINSELNRLRTLRTSNWRWDKLQHNRIGEVVSKGYEYPIYYDKKERIVYTCVRGSKITAAYIKDQTAIRSALEQHTKRLGIKVTDDYTNVGGDSVVVFHAMAGMKPAKYDARIDKLEEQFNLAIRQVEHKPLKSNGRHYRILSDSRCRYFVVVVPDSVPGPQWSELEQYINSITSEKRTFYSRIIYDRVPQHPSLWQKIVSIFRGGP